jgi:cell division protein FtsA
VVAIPGLRGRPPKEITLKNLAHIIQARMEEITEHVYYEIRNSGFEKKLIAGIVLTGGGALLKHLAQLTEFMTGMDTRIGYPNEHLSPETPDEMASPMYATGIGLVIQGVERYSRDKGRDEVKIPEMEEKFLENEAVFTEQEARPKEKTIREPKRQRSNGFLKRIQDWFEGDEI